MESQHREEDPPRSGDDDPGRGNPPAPESPPETSEHPSHEEEVGGRGAEDPSELADEDRYRKGPGW